MRWVMHLIGRLREGARRSAPIDPAALREQMKREEPSYQHVSDVQHDALGLIGASRAAQQLRDRFNERLRDSWRPQP